MLGEQRQQPSKFTHLTTMKASVLNVLTALAFTTAGLALIHLPAQSASLTAPAPERKYSCHLQDIQIEGKGESNSSLNFTAVHWVSTNQDQSEMACKAIEGDFA